MLRNLWRTSSFRFWISLSMALAVLPLAMSAISGYVLLNGGVMAPLSDIARRQREQVAPIQNLRVKLWDALPPVDAFVDDGGGQWPGIYRAERQQIERQFAALQMRLPGDLSLESLLDRARDDWTTADKMATELVSVQRRPGDTQAVELVERFHGKITAASDKLGALFDQVESDVATDYDIAQKSYERSFWLAGIALMLSLFAMVGGVVLIGHILSGSVDRLVDGATRFAAGDRHHRIDIHVPPELRRVADEFNRMIARIDESECTLADLARHDSLTKLLNRRAFDEELSQMLEQSRRDDKQGALLLADIDHFKKINDTYGHAVGDEVLRRVARTIESELRPHERLYRVGGEEFAVLLPSADAESPHVLAERLREAVAARANRVGEHNVSATLSLGLATTFHGIEAHELLDAADAALYHAKASGRNLVVEASGMGPRKVNKADPNAKLAG